MSFYLEETLARLQAQARILESEKIALDGHHYKGRFHGEKRVSISEGGSEYHTYERKNFYWTGQGMTTDVRTSETHRFLFVVGAEQEMGPKIGLETALILPATERDKGAIFIDVKKVRDYRSFLDETLEFFANEVVRQETEEEKILAIIGARKIAVEDLRSRDIII